MLSNKVQKFLSCRIRPAITLVTRAVIILKRKEQIYNPSGVIIRPLFFCHIPSILCTCLTLSRIARYVLRLPAQSARYLVLARLGS
jgi:hypothetical protein